jgi:hypothetical protein
VATGREAATTSQSRNLICARICARDAAGQAETGKTQKTRDDFIPHVCRGQRGDWRLPETAETHVVWLITQRRLATPRRAGTWPRRGSTASRKPVRGALREVRPRAPCALATPMTRVIAPTTLTALGLTEAPVHEPVHGRRQTISVVVTQRSGQDSSTTVAHLTIWLGDPERGPPLSTLH